MDANLYRRVYCFGWLLPLLRTVLASSGGLFVNLVFSIYRAIVIGILGVGFISNDVIL
jgi:hypothetical protein